MEASSVRYDLSLSGNLGNIDNSGFIGNIGDIHNNYSIGQVGDNITQVLGESQFHEPALDGYAPDVWIDPPEVHRIVRYLEEHRVVVLAGPMDDKSDCARLLSWVLRNRLSNSEMHLQVRERYTGRDPQHIEATFQCEETVVALLPETTPFQIAVDSLAKLRRLVVSRRGYAIVTTDGSRREWGVEEGSFEAQLWFEPTWDTFYGRDLLEEFMLRQLDPVPEGLLPEAEGEVLLVEGLPLRQAVERLKSPAQIQEFGRLIRLETDDVAAVVPRLLGGLAGDAQAILAWYRRLLPREQLLALGLTLFDGLKDDLLFAGLEILVDTAWRLSDPLLPQFDYQDLPRLFAYFKMKESEDGFVRIASGSRETRERILRLLWNEQRRRLLAALPALTELIRRSVELVGASPPLAEPSPSPAASPSQSQRSKSPPRPHEGEASPARVGKSNLRLSKADTQLLHQTLVEALSLIGQLSFEVVEPHFLDLAADRSESVQDLAARSLAAWRDDGHEAQLFACLQTWWAVASDYEVEDPRLERISRAGADPRASLRTAIARVVGYAAGFDRPNRMAEELVGLLRLLLDDKDRRVRAALAAATLPNVVTWHFRQLEPLLRTRVLLAVDLVPAVARGAAEACWLRPEESLPVLDGWRAAAKADRRPTSPLLRERLLATVALTYGYLRCDPTRELLSPEAVGARLRALLAEESHPYVRQLTFFALQLQAVRNFELVTLILQDLLSQVTLGDRAAAVEVFVRTYLHQRQRLSGGDQTIEVAQASYGIWIDSNRPLTKLEALLYSWILDESEPVAQQLAVDVFEAMAETALEQAELRHRAFRRPPVAVVAAPPDRTRRDGAPKLRDLPLLGRLAVYLAVPRKGRVRELLKPLVAELIAVNRRGSAPRTELTSMVLRPSVPAEKGSARRSSLLLSRWTSVANESTRAVSRHLRRVLIVYRWRWALIGLTLAAGVLFFQGSWTLYERLTESKAATEGAGAAPVAGGPPSSTTPTDEDRS